MAIEHASALLAEQGINVSATELETLIEAAVNGFNGGWSKSGVTDSSAGE